MLGSVLRRRPEPVTVDGLDDDEVYRCLSTERRRWLIRRLADADGVVELSTIADDMVECETFEGADRKALYIVLYQTHIPVLEQHGVVRTHGDSVTRVSATKRCGQLAAVMETVGGSER